MHCKEAVKWGWRRWTVYRRSGRGHIVLSQTVTVKIIRQTDNGQKTQQRWVLLCHKAVNNVLGHIGMLEDLQRQTASQLKKSNWNNYTARDNTQRVSHRFHFKGKQHMLHVWRHLVLNSSGSVLDGITTQTRCRNTFATAAVDKCTHTYCNAKVGRYSQRTGSAR